MNDWSGAILRLIREFSCLRIAHIEKLMARRHGLTREHTARMLRQLRTRGELMLRDGYATRPGHVPDVPLLECFDLMLELTGGAAEEITPGKPPVLLKFAVIKGEWADLFAVSVVCPGSESQMNAVFAQGSRNVKRLIIIRDISQIDVIYPPEKSWFALKAETADEQGNYYRFFRKSDT